MKKNILIIVAVIALVIVMGGVYYWTKTKSAVVPPAEIKALLTKLQSHLLLPTGETPQISQIADLTPEIQKQPFLVGAQKSDLLIVYVKASKAIVYSPSRDLIVNVGPISVNPEQPADQASVSTPAPTSTSVPVKK